MRLIFGQSVDKMEVENPIVFGGIKSHRCPVRRRGVLGVMSDFDPIDTKFSIKVEINAVEDYPKFCCDKLISYPAQVRLKKFNSISPLFLYFVMFVYVVFCYFSLSLPFCCN